MPHVLIVDGDPRIRHDLKKVALQGGYTVAEADCVRDALIQLDMQRPDLVLAEVCVSNGDGVDICRNAAALGSEVVVITGHGGAEAAARALRPCARDYLDKPVPLERLESIFKRVSTVHGAGTSGNGRGFANMLGESAPMREVYQQIQRVAPSDATVFISGESGTGKELAAQAVHELSRRRQKPFVAVNCGAVAPNLIESEMFGHERGSFTGADRQHKGYFERAHGGTLFLDEITEMPMDLQVKLLRVLETGRFMRVGTQKEIACNIRVVAATNRPPERAVREGKLRKDLYYRLAVFPLCLPPLRERGDDVVLLANHFLESMNREGGTTNVFTAEALDSIRRHDWPGNIRELRNHVRRAYIMAEGDTLDASPVSEDILTEEEEFDGERGVILPLGATLAEADRRLILATLAHCGGIKKRTAAVLGVSPKTLCNRLEAYAAAGYPVPGEEEGGRGGEHDEG